MKIAISEIFQRELDGRLPPDIEIAWYTGVGDACVAAEGADVLVIGFIDAGEIRTAIQAATSARWVATHAAGVDHYPLELLGERGQVLTNGAGINAPPIAEFAVMCVLSAAKSFPYFLSASERQSWPGQRPPAQELEGTRALVIGYGEIGREVGGRLRGLGVCVTGVRRQQSDDPRVLGPRAWRDRLGEFDWVLLTAALTGQTRHMIAAEELARMRPTAWLFNVARGGLLDHFALARAIQSGRPRGAYLDATEPEPLPAGHPLWGMPTVFITGHSAGRSPRSQQRYADLLLDNIERFRTGQPMRNVVDPSAGY